MTGEQAVGGVPESGELSAGATRGYVCPRRDQLFLLPVCMRDWLEEGHLAWFVLDVVAELDTAVLHRRPGGCAGRPPYEPEMMVGLLLYAYCCGVRSSRRMEAACRTDAAFRVICGGLVPDHATIARFVVDHERALEGLFVSGLRLCWAAGLADLSVVALDGTKVAADASLARNRDAEWIGREVAKLMAVTGEDEQPAAAGPDGLPGLEEVAELSSATGRMGRLRAALEVIETEDAARAAEAADRAAVAAAAAERGRKLGGRKPKEPLAALARAESDHAAACERVATMQATREGKLAAAARGERLGGLPPCRIERAKRALERAEVALAAAREAVKNAHAARRANTTDPDSRIMKTHNGWLQGYNGQAVVNQHHIVLACEVSQDVSDAQLYEPMTSTLAQTLTAAGIHSEVELVLADAGYWSDANATAPGPDRLIATTKDHKRRRAARERGETSGPPPPDATPLEEMEHLLRTPQGADAYAHRSRLIEPIFGDRKHNRGIRGFRRRGLSAARSEWAFMHLAGNLLKLQQHRAAAATA
ncbi:MAG: transposase [Solirubrobacterales bacterium]|nr:transposase [Solirubrobacterales bacterium]